MFLVSHRMPLRRVAAGATPRRMVLALLQAVALVVATPCSPSAAQDLPPPGDSAGGGDSSRTNPESSAADGQWVVRAWISGGISGRIVRVTIDGNRRLEASHSPTDAPCIEELGPDQVRMIETMIERSRPDEWRKTYDADGEACCDRIGASLQLERDEAGRKRVFETRWLLSGGNRQVPEEIRQLFRAVVDAREACLSKP